MTPTPDSALVTLFLAGDVMTGRGIDQILPSPSNPRLHEPYLKSALNYVDIAERASGPISRPVDYGYIWGDALVELQRVKPDARIVNLETAVTTSDDYWKGKGIHYRMHPDNIACLEVAQIDCCSLANNHVLDWGYAGLAETLSTLDGANVKAAGAGDNAAAAAAPAIIELTAGGRVLVFAFGQESSGIPRAWAASDNKPGVNLIDGSSDDTLRVIATRIRRVRRPGDIVVASVHWGANWGYRIPAEQKRFARRIIDEADVDLVHGHSSHHVKGIEVYNRRPIIYGCGDFINDYEGIGGYEEFKSNLGLMYFISIGTKNRELTHFHMTPTQTKRFQVRRAVGPDVQWLMQVLNREGRKLGTGVERNADDTLRLVWAP